jgi:hypothetical protein
MSFARLHPVDGSRFRHGLATGGDAPNPEIAEAIGVSLLSASRRVPLPRNAKVVVSRHDGRSVWHRRHPNG